MGCIQRDDTTMENPQNTSSAPGDGKLKNDTNGNSQHGTAQYITQSVQDHVNSNSRNTSTTNCDNSENNGTEKISMNSKNSHVMTPLKDQEEWANSLVGRWWEVFWEPSSPGACDSSSNADDDDGKKVSNGVHCTNDENVENKAIGTLIPNSAVPPQNLPSHSISMQGQTQQQQQQHHQQQQQNLPQSCPAMTQKTKLVDVVYKTPRLGLLLARHGDKLVVTSVLNGAPDAHLIKQNDSIMGVNGNPILPFQSNDDYNTAISTLRNTPRPMLVTFVRLVAPPVKQAVVAAAPSVAMSGEGSTALENTAEPPSTANNALVTSAQPHHHNGKPRKISLSSIKSLAKHSHLLLPKGKIEHVEPIPQLGTGWFMHVVARNKPDSSGPRADRYFISPNGQRFRSLRELERYLNSAADDDDIDDIPLSVLAAQPQNQQHTHTKKRPCGKHEKKHAVHNANDGQSEDDDSDDEEDAADWYDAKIMAYNNEMFVVHFLGDDEDVTYTMPLIPSVVRPSARVWAKRSLALISFNENGHDALANNTAGGISTTSTNANAIGLLLKNTTFDTFSTWVNQIGASLPPSTDFPEDTIQQNTNFHQDRWGSENASGFWKIREYKKWIEIQIHLCTRLSPTDDDDEKDESGDDGDDDRSDDAKTDSGDGPGPFANSIYIEHLCDCLRAANEACDWLLKESVAWEIMKNISTNVPIGAFSIEGMGIVSTSVPGPEAQKANSRVSKDTIHRCLVHGAKALHQILLSSDPSKEAANMKHKTSKQGASKKRKQSAKNIHNGTSLYNGMIAGATFEALQAKASSSNDALNMLLTGVLKKSSEQTRRSLIHTTITQFLSIIYENLWKPAMDWIERANDIECGASERSYSFEDVESHKVAADNMGHLRLIDLSFWTTKLEAKLNRARFFEMEAWSAIQACTLATQLDASSIVASADSQNDACLVALCRLKNEAASSVVGNSMRNLNPLGRRAISPTGIPIPSSLTRTVIDDAIVIRTWVLDFIRAKTVRERASFLEVSIRIIYMRYVY